MTSKEMAWKIRRHCIEMTHLAHGSHVGSMLSVADIVAVLYMDILNIFPQAPMQEDRDRFILSKGHAGAAVYAALAESGFFDPAILGTYCANGSMLPGHISHKNVPGVELSTGSLGHGLSVAAGMALAATLDNKPHKIYVVIGDGECDEGSIWEAALFANQFALTNLTVIIDHNQLQGLGFCKNVIDLDSLTDKWSSFGWDVTEVCGHDHDALRCALSRTGKSRPSSIVARTIKGKGVPYMENKLIWHYRDPQDDYYEAALKALEAETI